MAVLKNMTVVERDNPSEEELFWLPDEANTSSVTGALVIMGAPFSYPTVFENTGLYEVVAQEDLTHGAGWPQASRLKFEAQLREFLIGNPAGTRPSSLAATTARRILRAVERLDQPAIIVDEDGTLALDLRLNPRVELFIELLPNNQVNATMFDDATRKLISVRGSTVSKLVALIEASQ